MAKSNLGEEMVYFTHSSSSQAVRTGTKQGGNLEPGADARPWRVLLTLTSHGLLGLLSYRSLDH